MDGTGGAGVVVVTGNPTPQELAAVIAVLFSRGTTAGEPEPAPVSSWNERGSLLRRPLHPGPGAWNRPLTRV
jgi:hypothetical protein